MNYAVKISYLGKNYSGWQVQPDALSIQEVIEGVLAKIEGSPVRITGAGRTDKGVNAFGQVASFRLSKNIIPEKISAVNRENILVYTMSAMIEKKLSLVISFTIS